MKHFYPTLFVIVVLSLFTFACGETDSVSYDTEYQSVTPTYPNGTDLDVSGGNGGGSTGGSTGGDGSTGGSTGGDTGGSTGGEGTGGGTGEPNFNPEVMLRTVGGKYCSWVTAGYDSLCARVEADIEDPNARSICWGSNKHGMSAVPKFEKNDPRFGQVDSDEWNCFNRHQQYLSTNQKMSASVEQS